MRTVYSSKPSCVLVDSMAIKGRVDAAYYDSKYQLLEDELSRVPSSAIKVLGELILDARRVLYQNTRTFDRSEAPEGAIPFISGVDLDGKTMSINWDTVRYVEPWMLEKYPKGQLFDGSLLIKVKGPNQHTVYIPSVKHTALVSGTVFFAKVRNCNPYYLTAYLSSKSGVMWRARLRTNTTVEFIGNDELRNVPVFVPEDSTQEFIGKKLELAERCKLQAEKLWHETFQLLDHIFEDVPSTAFIAKHNYVDASDLSSLRMDAWYYQKHFMVLDKWLHSNRSFMPLTEIATLVATKRGEKTLSTGPVNYVEISSIDIPTSIISPLKLEKNELPASAKKALLSGDIIASTVRVNRKCIAVVPKHLDEAIGSTALAVLRTSSIEDAYFLEAVLKHDVSTAQIMRWNTGSVYPTVSEDVFQKILVPGVDRNIRKKIGTKAKRRSDLLYTSRKLIAQAQADVEALIEGTLDTNAILSGKLKPPTWEDVEKELKEM